MSDKPIEPIHPVRPVRDVQEIGLRRRPSLGQLRQWLNFARKKGKQRKAALAAAQTRDGDDPAGS